MQTLQKDHSRLWSIILAGEGNHQIGSLIQQWVGGRKPKQFCTFVGSRSMLQHTWDRADQLSHPNCKITIVGKFDLQGACSQLGGRVPGILLSNPQPTGLMGSLFLALTYLRARDPNSVVVVYPSDHFVYPESQFLRTVQRGVWAAERLAEQMIAIGVAPIGSAPSCGWFRLGPQLGWASGTPIYSIKTFEDTLVDDEHDGITAAGQLWNTSIIIAQTDALWRIGWKCVPYIMTQLEQLEEAIGTSYERAVLDSTSHRLEELSPSFHLLYQNPERIAVLELEEVTWSNWESPQQIVETLAAIGKSPTFALEYVSLALDVSNHTFDPTREVIRKYAG